MVALPGKAPVDRDQCALHCLVGVCSQGQWIYGKVNTVTSILKRVRRALSQHRDRQFLLALDGSQQSDVGVSSTDLHSLASRPADTRERMEAMARAHGLAPEMLGREHWRQVDMARACGHCGQRGVCRKWLTGKRRDLAARDFCPNAPQFEELANSSE